MKLNRSLLALLCSGMLAAAVYAEDAPAPEKKEAPKAEKKEKAKPVKLVQPYSLIESLSPEQKEQINKIHLEALEETKKIKDKEEADCMAVLTAPQKEELEKALEKQKAEKKGADHKKSAASTKPAE